MNFDENQVFNAYKKLKHYFFYDNTTLLVKQKLAKFEQDSFDPSLTLNEIKVKLHQKIEIVFKAISSDDKVYLNDNLNITILPKKVKQNKRDIITNNFKNEDKIEIERLNIYIDAPIEIHIISVLWVMYVGRFLNVNLGANSYANKLDLILEPETDDPKENFKLYKPYFVQYQQWRDHAIQKTESLLNDSKNVTILSLDIKEYYHNVKLNFETIKKDTNSSIDYYYSKNGKVDDQKTKTKLIADSLNNVLELIHEIYFFELTKYQYYEEIDLSEIKKSKMYPLPIGLLSSGFLGNYFLKDFDNAIEQDLNPAFYGRYVDDLMFVFADLNQHVKEGLISSTVSFINKNFVKKGFFEIDTKNEVSRNNLFRQVQTCDNNTNFEYVERICEDKLNKLTKKFEPFELDSSQILSFLVDKIEFRFKNKLNRDFNVSPHFDYSSLVIQASKVVSHYFNHKESRAVLNIFKKKLEEQRSEFRFLPDEDLISEQFDEEAFTIKYGDSINKFRSIEDFSENKYGASKFLAKKIFARSFGDAEIDEITDQQILTFFNGAVALNFYSLWEKVVTYFVITNRPDLLLEFRRNIEKSILKLKLSNCVNNSNLINDIENIQINTLRKFLDISISIAISLRPDIEFKKTKQIEQDQFIKIKEESTSLRRSNLFRSSLISIPTINYSKYAFEDINYLENDFSKQVSAFDERKKSVTSKLKDKKVTGERQTIDMVNSDKKNKETLSSLNPDEYLSWLAPTYIPFHEVNILKIVDTVANAKIGDFDSFNSEINEIPNKAFVNYYLLNYGWKSKYEKDNAGIKALQRKYFEVSNKCEHKNNDCKKSKEYYDVRVFGDDTGLESHNKVNKNLAIANIKVLEENIKKSILRKPNLDRNRRKQIFKLLNDADRLNSDLIAFPEVSVPYSWIKLIAERSHKRFMGIVGGLEHWVNKDNIAFNLMVTILPFKVHDYTTSIIKVRLKNHYSPGEKQLLSGYRLLIPEATSNLGNRGMSYDLFHWRKTYFSVYNCFELANIYHRSLFKSKVDFIIASEFNRDTEYFADVAGAWVRDVHAFFIQVNSSHYGDSRLLQPSKSYTKDLIQVKGGLNSTVLVDEMDIVKLRQFQYMEYNLQQEMITNNTSNFKHTPPDFNRDNVLIRIENGKL